MVGNGNGIFQVLVRSIRSEKLSETPDSLQMIERGTQSSFWTMLLNGFSGKGNVSQKILRFQGRYRRSKKSIFEIGARNFNTTTDYHLSRFAGIPCRFLRFLYPRITLFLISHLKRKGKRRQTKTWKSPFPKPWFSTIYFGGTFAGPGGPRNHQIARTAKGPKREEMVVFRVNLIKLITFN